MSNDGMSGGAGTQQRKNYGEHELSYLDEGTRSTSHSIPSISETNQIESQSHPMKSNEGSPPPNSATTSGSTSTPSSVGGLSSGGDVKHSEQPRGSIPSHFSQPAHQQAGEGWSVSVAEGIMTQPYVQEETVPAGHSPSAEVSFSDNPDGRYNPSAYPSAIKLLVSNNVAGSIIGRAGQTISELQTQSSARIKLSQTGDYYPGTQDRVCLVQGELENVKVAVRLLLERLHMLQEQQHSQHLTWQPKPDAGAPTPTNFDFVVRLLVPSSSCGMIIGKAGANIKHMEESSGVSSVRLSPKDVADPNSPTATIISGTAERVVTLTGPSVESCLKCLYIVLDGMSANHEICRYTNLTTSYSRLVVPGAYTPVQPGRPVLVVPSPAGEWDAAGPYAQFMGKRSSSQPDLTHMAVDQQRLPSRIPPGSPGPSLSHVGPRESGLSQYNPAFPEVPPAYSAEMPPMMPSPARGPPSTPAAAPPMYLFPTPVTNQMEHPSIPSSSSAPDLLTLQFQDSMRVSNPPNAAPIDYTHFAPQLPQPTPPGFTAQVLVPDTLIGSILGRGGKALNELQMHSNTRIRISQRGEYVPGTRNRVVTIRGPTAHSVSLAQYLMSQRMVLPPTATFSQQGGPFLHPSHMLQPQQTRVAQHQTPMTTQHPTTISPAQHQVLHESGFLPADPRAASAPTSSLTLSRSSSSKEPPPHNS